MIAFIVVALTSIVGLSFCIVVARALWQWRGIWRWAAGIALALMLAVVLNIVNAIRIDPTAHNLWPLELLAWFCLANVCVGFLYLARWVMFRSRRT